MNPILQDICSWNRERDNLEYNTAVEFTMLTEELQEYLLAKQKNMLAYADMKDKDPYAEDTFTNMSEEDRELLQQDILVDEADGLGDTIFVAYGGLFKLTNGDTSKVVRIMEAIVRANNKKGRDKVDGKIIKPKDFVGPEEEIRKILFGDTDG